LDAASERFRTLNAARRGASATRRTAAFERSTGSINKIEATGND
jgi:hypothetical protein